jgi:hypothetical protein
MDGNSNLRQVCQERGIVLDELLNEIDEIDWERELESSTEDPQHAS